MKPPAPGSGAGARKSEPVTFGLPLPEGASRDGDPWRLVSADGTTATTQTRVLDRWHDRSVRWLLVDGRVDLHSDRSAEYFLEQGPAAAGGGLALSISQGNGSVLIDTSVARFTVRPGQAFLFQAVDQNAGSDEGTRACALQVTDESGVERPVVASSIEVEERGPLRSVVVIKGAAPGGSNGRTLDLIARLHFFAGLPIVRLLVTLTNPNAALHKGGFWDLGDPGSILVRDISLTVTGVGGSSIRVSPEMGSAWTSHAVPFELYQDSSGGEHWQSTNHINRERRVPTTFRGYIMTSGGREQRDLRATPALGLNGIGLAVPHFWQNFPKAIEVTSQALTLRLFPGRFADLHEIQGGEQKTHECFLSFGADPVSDEPLAWCRARAVPCVDPEWTMATGAVAFLAPLDTEHDALVGTAVEGPDSFALKREVIDEYGWRHFGEIYGDHESVRQQEPPIVSHYNNQYDPIAGFVYQHLRTADPRWWTMAAELASHVIDIDVYHTTRDKSAYNGGLFWHTYHYGDADTATHRTYPREAQGRTHGGGPSADHNYTTGLMLHYFLTGDEASRRTAIGLGQFVIDLDDGRKTVFRWLDRGDTGRAILSATSYFGPGRGPANSLNALLDAHRLSGEARFLAKADQVVRRVVNPEQDIARLRLDVPEQRWFYTMFLQSLGKYLHYKRECRAMDDMYSHGRASLLRFARWMIEHEHPYLDKPDKLEFPTETWPAQDIRKSDILHFAALHATGAERVAFEAQARVFHRYSIRTLAGFATRTLARPVVILLTSGFLDGWRARNPDAAEPNGTLPSSFEPTVPFVPQRARAERRAMLLFAVVVLAALVTGLAAIL